MSKIKRLWQEHKQLIRLGAISFLLIAGVVQQALDFSYVIKLTPVMLAIVMAVMLCYWDISPKRKLVVSVAVIVFGFIVELIGVNTGLLFGDYRYYPNIGIKLFETPIIIGVTWLVVTLSAWQIATLNYGANKYKKYLLALLLVLMFDLVLEQFAVSYSLWQWQNGGVPLYNYVSWLVVSAVIFIFYDKFIPKKSKSSLFIMGILPMLAIFFWLMLIF